MLARAFNLDFKSCIGAGFGVTTSLIEMFRGKPGSQRQEKDQGELEKGSLE